jgi:hypothetical protein
MSLIDDALKRAQEEAARQDEAHRLARRPWIAPQPPRKRSPAGRLGALALAFALAAAGSAAPLVPALENVEVPPPAAARPASERPKTNRAVPESDPVSENPPGEKPAPSPAPARPPRAAPIPDGKTFVRTVNLPGENPIELDGIVFSETNPVAVIGGHLLGPGSSVGDFEIVKIEENRVTLRGRGVTIFLTPS